MEHGRHVRQWASETIRKQKRKELDARRSKCRIRIGGHLEQWCQLKEQLGFSLHSQLAKYLLDRYSSQDIMLKTGQSNGSVVPPPFSSDALQHLVVLSHNHSQECGFIPNVKSSLLEQKDSSMVWECLAGHTFSWSPATPQPPPPSPCKTVPICQEEKTVSSKPSPPLSPITRRRRSIRRAAAAHAFSLALVSNSPCPVDEAEPSSKEDREGSADREGPASVTPDSGADLGEEAKLQNGSSIDETAAPSEELQDSAELVGPESTLSLSEGTLEPLPGPPKEEEEREDLAEDDILAYTDDLQDENYHPSQDSDKKRVRSGDEDVQIGPKRIRKAAKREILLCDYDGCGKIFSNRQYLNHHKKYQHVHQKTFTCSDPSCGKSFNFKKHLKEHEKLHSDKRDYICEFCARSFRTSSNLIIHRRIHTGEKPLQCEICGFTCRQKASLNWHMKKHDADSFYQFSCDLCGKKFEKKDNVTAHKSKSHPEGVSGPPQTTQEPPEPPALSSPLANEQLEKNVQAHPSDPERRVDESALVITVTIE